MDRKLNDLKHLIDTGAVPEIVESTFISNKYSCQDVVTLGYGTIQRIYMGLGGFETWFIYNGPMPIKINDVELEEGDMIETIILEYTND